MAEYDPFDDMEEDSYARPQGISCLQIGVPYKVISLFQNDSKFRDQATGTFPKNTVIQYYESGLRFQTILPKKFNNKTKDWIDAMNKLIKKGMGPQVVYYGTLAGHEVDLLRHTQGVDQAKLETVKRLMEKGQSPTSTMTSPTKRPNEGTNSESPNKVSKT